VKVELAEVAPADSTAPVVLRSLSGCALGAPPAGDPACEIAATSRGGIASFTDLVLQRMGRYSLRFYSEALEGLSASFYVSNGEGVALTTERSPRASSCKSSLPGAARCSFGGLLQPQPRFALRDRFGNLALSGSRRFRIVLFVNPAQAVLACAQRGRDVAGNLNFAACEQDSAGGVVEFTDLSLDNTGLGYRFRLDNADGALVPAAFSDPFDVYSVERMALAREPGAIAAGCRIERTPVVSLSGYLTGTALIQTPVTAVSAEVAVVACASPTTNVSVAVRFVHEAAGRDVAMDLVFVRAPESRSGRPHFSAVGGGAPFLYWCSAVPALGCAAGGGWVASFVDGLCAGDFAESWGEQRWTLSVCGDARGPESQEGPWRLRNSSLDLEDTAGGAVAVQRQTEQCVARAQAGLAGGEAAVEAGIATFSALTLNVSAALTLRFRLRFPDAVKEFALERSYAVRANGLAELVVLQQPSDTVAAVQPQRAPRIRVLDLSRAAVSGWTCEGFICATDDGRVQVTAEVAAQDDRAVQSTAARWREVRAADGAALELLFVPLTAGDAHTVRFGASYTDACSGQAVNLTARTAPFAVLGATPAALVFVRAPPAEVRAGEPFVVEVALVDPLGNPLSQFAPGEHVQAAAAPPAAAGTWLARAAELAWPPADAAPLHAGCGDAAGLRAGECRPLGAAAWSEGVAAFPALALTRAGAAVLVLRATYGGEVFAVASGAPPPPPPLPPVLTGHVSSLLPY